VDVGGARGGLSSCKDREEGRREAVGEEGEMDEVPGVDQHYDC